MLEKVREYFESELRQTEADIKRPWADKGKIIWYAILRCSGVANFVIEHCDIPYEIIDPLYEEYRQKLQKLLFED
jgi:hypothetical protein